MTLEEFEEYVEQVIENDIPPEILEGLNLGVVVSTALLQDPQEPAYYIKGHYIQNISGKQVVLYYGTFKYFYENHSEESWKKKVLATIKHELTHHVEARAKQEDLAHQEQAAKLARKLAKEQKKKDKKDKKDKA